MPLWLAHPLSANSLLSLVDWRTIAALTGLLILSRGLEDSGYLARGGHWLLHRVHNTRSLAMLLIVFSAALAAVVTNDVALFIVIPLTLSLSRVTPLPVGRLIIFEALAVNAGSTISPIGNPQNLFLWQTSNASFIDFVVGMSPLAALLMALLLLYACVGFETKKLTLSEQSTETPVRSPLFWWSLALYPVFLILTEQGWAIPATMAVLILFALRFRFVLAGVDWLLLLVFALMFIDLGLLARVDRVRELALFSAELPGGWFTSAALLSQGISNVPATILLAEFTDDWRLLAWGVSIGGFGFALGSLANLIALRLARQPGLWREFHAWSVPLFLVSLALGGWLNMVLN
ncbi:MAG: transporter [Natronospirillum sp.]